MKKKWNNFSTKKKALICVGAFIVLLMLIGLLPESEEYKQKVLEEEQAKIELQQEREAAKLEKEMQAKKQAELEASPEYQYNEWVKEQFSTLGRNYDLEFLVKDNLNDSKSFEHIETIYTDYGLNAKEDNKPNIIVIMKFRAKNKLGGYVVNEVTAHIDYDTNSIKIKNIN